MNRDRIVCLCNGVSKKEILRLLRKGAVLPREIQQITLAGTSCGRCRGELNQIVDDYNQTRKPEAQMKIRFE